MDQLPKPLLDEKVVLTARGQGGVSVSHLHPTTLERFGHFSGANFKSNMHSRNALGDNTDPSLFTIQLTWYFSNTQLYKCIYFYIHIKALTALLVWTEEWNLSSRLSVFHQFPHEGY